MKLIEGYTLMHEHIAIDLSGVKKDEDCRLDCYDETVRELKKLYGYGVRNILEVTNIGMGRDVEYMRRVSEATGIHIIMSTGFYKEPFLPDFVYQSSARELAELIESELTEGIEETGLCASVIGEIGTGKNRMTEMEKMVFDAAALAAVKTEAPITTHTTLGTIGVQQADYLIRCGVKPEKIIIGHMDLSQNIDTILAVLKRGVTVGFDTVGKNNYCPDSFRVKALKRIAEEGLISNVVLSMDITRKSHMEYKGGIGYAYLFEYFLPMMREHGIPQEQIDILLRKNPERILLP